MIIHNVCVHVFFPPTSSLLHMPSLPSGSAFGSFIGGLGSYYGGGYSSGYDSDYSSSGASLLDFLPVVKFTLTLPGVDLAKYPGRFVNGSMYISD